MKRSVNGSVRSGATAGMLLAGAVGLLALPSAVLAIAASSAPDDAAAAHADALSNDAPPANLARAMPIRSLAKGKLYRFTPAETPSRPDRSVTVAVRVDPSAAKGMLVVRGKRSALAGWDAGELRIAPTAFNLGISRGYANFSQSLVPAAGVKPAPTADLTRFSLASGGKPDESRFNPRIALDETQAAGRAPRTFAGDGDDQVDLGGAYRLTRNLDVTAGVRYSRDRERLLPLTDGKQDNQAVYVGTAFRF
ncbi:MAG TPA: hypothetical protein VJM34_16530 [Novosphingobium sp.]|nr:hypothetical protein [Novosphingobium sp.]